MNHIVSPYVQYMYSYPHKTAYGPLEGIELKDYVGQLLESENSLYFHIPFCQSKCGYCNLFSVTGQKEAFMTEYVDAMERHAAQLSEVLLPGTEFHDLTLGGGTPLLLPPRQLERIFEIAQKYMGFAVVGQPIIVETSPKQTTEEKLTVLKENHVTRVSMGVQSFFDEELQTLNRAHGVAEVEHAVALLKDAKFPCVNLDLIYGIPGQTKESLLESARRAVAYEPEELFVYPLYVKQGTYLWNRGVECQQSTYEMYLALRDYLIKEGYVPHSMRRFVKQGAGYQLGSCGFESTISIGCGGRSYVGNLHFCTPYAVRQSACLDILKKYIEQDNYLQIHHGYLLSQNEQKRRYVIKNILFGSGINKEEYHTVFGGEVVCDFLEISQWINEGYAMENTEQIMLTEIGFSLSDYLGPQLISEEVYKKMERYWDGD